MAERAAIEPTTAPPRLLPRPDRGLTADYAIRRTMRDHRGVFAALAESERRDREAEVGRVNVRRGLAS